MPTSGLHPNTYLQHNTDAQTYCIVALCFTSITSQVCDFGLNVFVFEWHGIIQEEHKSKAFYHEEKVPFSLLYCAWDWTQTRNWPKFLSVVPFKGIMTKQLQKGSNLRQNLFSTRKILSLSRVHLPQKVSGTQEERRNQVGRKVESRASKQNGWCQRGEQRAWRTVRRENMRLRVFSPPDPYQIWSEPCTADRQGIIAILMAQLCSGSVGQLQCWCIFHTPYTSSPESNTEWSKSFTTDTFCRPLHILLNWIPRLN